MPMKGKDCFKRGLSHDNQMIDKIKLIIMHHHLNYKL